jgi:hypothetical protein
MFSSLKQNKSFKIFEGCGDCADDDEVYVCVCVRACVRACVRVSVRPVHVCLSLAGREMCMRFVFSHIITVWSSLNARPRPP